MYKTMNLESLKSGMRVTYKNGEQRIVLTDAMVANENSDPVTYPLVLTNIPKHDAGGVKNKFCDMLAEYSDNLKHKTESKWDIMKVEIPCKKFRLLSTTDDDYVCVWQRIVKCMTLEEIANELGYEVELKD